MSDYDPIVDNVDVSPMVSPQLRDGAMYEDAWQHSTHHLNNPREPVGPVNDIDFLSVYTAPPNIFRGSRGIDVNKVRPVLVNLAIQIYGFVRCEDRSNIQIFSSVNGILMALGLDVTLYKWIAEELWHLVTGKHVRPESLEQLGEALGKDAVKYVTANLAKIVEKVIKFCSAALIAPSLMASKSQYFKHVGNALNKCKFTSFTCAALSVDSVASMLAHCVSRTIEVLVNWTFPDEVNELLRESVLMRTQVEEELKTMSRETRDHLVFNLQGLAARLTNLHFKMRGDRFTVAQALLKELDLVVKLRNTVGKHAIDTRRVPIPISLNIIGEPAIGKSEIINVVMHIIASVKREGPNSCPYEPHEICDAPMSKYFNNLTNQTRVVIFDDINAVARQGEKADCVAARWAEHLIMLVNPHGFKPELARAEDKGTVQPHLDVVISTANFENQNGNIYGMNNWHAVARRLDKMFVELKDDYMGSDGKLDVSKLAAKGGSLYEINPWKISYKVFNLKKALQLKMANRTSSEGDVPTNNCVENNLWEYVTFEYNGEQLYSQDITFDMLRELLRQRVNRESNDGDVIRQLDKATISLLFPGTAPIEQPEAVEAAVGGDEVLVVQPQTRSVGHLIYDMLDADKYLAWGIRTAVKFGLVGQTVGVITAPISAAGWHLYRICSYRRPNADHPDRLGFRAYARESAQRFNNQFKLLFLCWGFNFLAWSGPVTRSVLRFFGCTGEGMIALILLGNHMNGFMNLFPVDGFSPLLDYFRQQYTDMIAVLASEERRKNLQRVLLKGLFAGVALGTLIKVAQGYLQAYEVYKITRELDKRVGSDPVSDPQSTVDKDGNVNVVLDPKVDVAPRHVTFKGTFATMLKENMRRSNPTQTVEDSRYRVGRCVFRATIKPCTGAQLGTTVYSEHSADMYVFGYDTYASGTYIVTVAHAFAREYSHFSVRIHDSSRVTQEHIVCKKDIVFAPRMCMNGSQHDIDMCMFEMPRSTTGSLPVVRKYVDDVHLKVRETVTRLVPSYDKERGIYAVEVLGAEFLGIKSHAYSAGSPAASLLKNPVSYWIEGFGDDGLCGSLTMSGDTIVAMHTGSHAPSEAVTACPINLTTLNSMKARLAGRSLGTVSNTRLDEYVIRAPYLEEYESSKLEIDPNVSVRIPGALEPALANSYYDFVGTLTRGGEAVNVRARSNISISKHVEMLMDYLPNVPHIMRAYAIPSVNWKMRDTISAFIAKSSIPRPVDTHLLSLAKEKVGKALFEACWSIVDQQRDFANMGVLNMQGALDGKGLNMAGKVPINTSVGVAFPGTKANYVSNVFCPEHNEHFVCFHEDNEVSMEIHDSVYDIIKRRKAGEVGLILNFICPKDEVLPVKEGGKTKPMRHINTMDFAHTLVIRMYFQPILILLGYDPLACGHSVGLDPTAFYLEMMKSLVNGDTSMPLYMHEVQDSAFVATDYSGFDLSLSGDVISAVMDIFINLSHLLQYSDDDRRVMASIAYDICNPAVVMLGTIVKMAGVNTSGNPLTTMINCVANMLINCQIHAMIKFDTIHDKYMVDYPRDYSSLTVRDIDFSLRSIVTYGDDVVLRVGKGSNITQPATIYYGRQLGYVITGSDKGDTVTEYAQDFGFLKRKFNLYAHKETGEVVMCLAPLAMDSIFKPFVWGDFKKVDINDHYAGLIKSALHELVQHGECIYEMHSPKLWAFVEAFSVETKPKKNSTTVFRSCMRSRFKEDSFPSWKQAVSDKYYHFLNRTNSELTLSDLELFEL